MLVTSRSDAPAREPRAEAADAVSATDPSLKDVTLSDTHSDAYVRYHAHNPVSTQGQMHVHLHNV